MIVDWGVFGFDHLHPNRGLLIGNTRYLSSSHFKKGYDAVIDLAAIPNDPAGDLDPAMTFSVNAEARRRNAQLAREAGVKRYILGSSCSVYGITDVTELATESTPVNPQTTYAQAAVEAERGVLENFPDATVLRQATVYGVSPKMRWDLVVNAFVRDIWRDDKVRVFHGGEQFRPLVYIEDTVGAMLTALDAELPLVAGQTFNIVGENVQIYRLAEDLAEHFGVDVEYDDSRVKDTRSYRVSGEKFQKTLNRFCRKYVKEAAEDMYNGLEMGLLDPDIPSTVDVYRKWLMEKAEV
jgi:nucleoside-diphosphate-sugar epimerase